MPPDATAEAPLQIHPPEPVQEPPIELSAARENKREAEIKDALRVSFTHLFNQPFFNEKIREKMPEGLNEEQTIVEFNSRKTAEYRELYPKAEEALNYWLTQKIDGAKKFIEGSALQNNFDNFCMTDFKKDQKGNGAEVVYAQSIEGRRDDSEAAQKRNGMLLPHVIARRALLNYLQIDVDDKNQLSGDYVAEGSSDMESRRYYSQKEGYKNVFVELDKMKVDGNPYRISETVWVVKTPGGGQGKDNVVRFPSQTPAPVASSPAA